jgi:penicillin amidase
MIGVTLPGTPVTIVGSNSHVAWGFTNAAGDWLDLVRLDQDVNHPGQVRVGDEWVTPTLYAETINVKNGQPEKFLVKETALGPIEEFDGQIYAVHWLAQAPQAVDFGILKLESAATADDALQIGAAAGIPELNMIAGDDQGHIGWTIAGPMPARGKPGITATFPLEPEQADAGWQNLLPPSSHPRILDPKDGQLQTANSRTLMGEGSAQIGDGGFDLGARTRQIRDDLTALGNNIEVKSAYQVALDDRAIFMEGWRAKALALLDDSALKDHPDRAKFRKLLTESWDGHASVNSVGYRLARGFLDQLYGICFGALDEKLAALDRGADYVLATKRWPVVLDRLLTAQPVAWLPAGYADWRAVQLAAIDASITELTANGAKLEQASWGARNRAKISHPFARFLPSFVARYLSAPMDMLPGDSNLPRVAAPSMGASERFAVSPGKEEAGVFNLPGGQSGHPLSPFFLKGHEDWVLGVPTPLLPGAPKYGLVLTPS